MNTILLVGVVSDSDCESYKRKPIISENDRVEIVRNIKIVDNIIFPAPLVVDMDFIKKIILIWLFIAFLMKWIEKNRNHFMKQLKIMDILKK
jgi:glycerol-3-phosphate cytidylyltransferase-like family protein